MAKTTLKCWKWRHTWNRLFKVVISHFNMVNLHAMSVWLSNLVMALALSQTDINHTVLTIQHTRRLTLQYTLPWQKIATPGKCHSKRCFTLKIKNVTRPLITFSLNAWNTSAIIWDNEAKNRNIDLWKKCNSSLKLPNQKQTNKQTKKKQTRKTKQRQRQNKTNRKNTL